MDSTAKFTSKAQVTIPKSVRDALELHEGDELLFPVERSRAVIAKTRNLLELAGSVPAPAEKRGTPWDEACRRTWNARARSDTSCGRTVHVLGEPQGAYTKRLREGVPRPGWKPKRRLREISA